MITFDSNYKGYEVYSGSKSLYGLNTRILDSLLELVEYSLDTMLKPKGFHVIIESPDNISTTNLPKKISRWAEQRKLRTQPVYLWCKEIRPKAKNQHLHLHVVADSCTYDDVVFLVDSLKSMGNARHIPRDPETLPDGIDPRTGKPKKIGSIWFHDLKKEKQDYIKRASYLSKVFTKVQDLKNWSCSNLTNRSIFHQKKKTSETVYQDLLQKIPTVMQHRLNITMNLKQQVANKTRSFCFA